MTDQIASSSTSMDPPEVTGLRSSGRTRVKTQRALESEQLDRVLAQAKSRERESAALASASPDTSIIAAKAKKKTSKSKSKGGKKESEVYCICKTAGDDGRPMIECEHCNDWFHFDCINLSEHAAERIQKFVCAECEQRTGEKTTHVYDITAYPSPSPPPGVDKPANINKTKRKTVKITPKRQQQQQQQAAPGPDSAASSSSSDDEGSVVDGISSSSSSSGSEHGVSSPKARKRARVLPPQSKPKRDSIDRKASLDRPVPLRKPSSATPISVRATGALPPARAHVLRRMTAVVQGLFEDRMSAEIASGYAKELEAALWSGLKEVVNGKEAVGSRYKAQFNLLSSSLSKLLRPEIRDSILNHTLTPAQVATLTSLDLASETQLKEMEAAKQAVLEQTVKSRDDQGMAIRLGRDGLERAEDMREKEMAAIRAAEQTEREKERRRESIRSQPEDTETEESSMKKDKAVAPSPGGAAAPRRSESVDIRPPSNTQSPVVPSRRDFGISSAWGKAENAGGQGVNQNDVEMAFGDSDQVLDFSDIVVDEPTDGMDESFSPPKEDGVAAAPEAGPSDLERFESRPVVWSGGLVNPADVSPHIPPVQIRHISSRPFPPSWSVLLPRSPIEITGRVPVLSSIKFLSDARLSPTKELVVVALTLYAKASDDELIQWESMIDFHINKDRHGVYLPYGNDPVPPGGAKEFYLIPLRPTDPSPEFTELIDGYDLPSTGRGSLFLGVFVMNRDPTPQFPPALPSIPSIPSVPPPAQNSAPVLPNAQLQALMASLNPQSLQSVLSQGIPTPPHAVHSPVVTTQTPLGGGYTPPPASASGYYPPPAPIPPVHQQQGYPAYPPYPPYGGHTQGGYRPPPPPLPAHTPGWRDDRRGGERDRSPIRRGGRGGGAGGGRRDFDRQRPSDNGWGNRPRGGGDGGGRGGYDPY